jgi:hypothetical protein
MLEQVKRVPEDKDGHGETVDGETVDDDDARSPVREGMGSATMRIMRIRAVMMMIMMMMIMTFACACPSRQRAYPDHIAVEKILHHDRLECDDFEAPRPQGHRELAPYEDADVSPQVRSCSCDQRILGSVILVVICTSSRECGGVVHSLRLEVVDRGDC